MAKPLVIVESPTKAKTISRFLGDSYLVESSIGHIRDLPKSAAEIPAAYKKESWSRLGVDVNNRFKPLYVVSDKKKQHISHLKQLVKEASEIYLATDEDREGESIAWHLMEVLSPKVPVRRMVFHEITKAAIDDAIAHPREIDTKLVSAQEARRILDRLYGYEVSPVLWKKIKPALSAGRVQSVATRVLVQRERERINFVSAGYSSLKVAAVKDKSRFIASLQHLDDVRVATGRDFGADGTLSGADTSKACVILAASDADLLSSALNEKTLRVVSVEEKPYRRSPAPPFRTSTLQQEAGRKLRFSSSRTMSAAQRLYEAGHITYMRTDSTYLADVAVAYARKVITELYGASHLPKSSRDYKNNVKNAQEAHEAIRPSGDNWIHPNEMARLVSSDEARLYELIWKRTIASQMTDVLGTTVTVKFVTPLSALPELGAQGGRRLAPNEARFSSSGRVISHSGFMAVYVEDSDDNTTDEEDAILPAFAEGELIPIDSVEVNSHVTNPPSRYTEASLVKTLEDLGVGRPSTYASIITTILDRGYVFKRGSALVPSFIAFSVVNLLEQFFSDLVDYNFTAELENTLDQIATGSTPAIPYLEKFYFGNGHPGLKDQVANQLDRIDPREINSIPVGITEDGELVEVRVGRFGPFLSAGDRSAPIPDGMAPDELTFEVAVELLEKGSGDRVLGVDPDTNLPVMVKVGRFGPFVQLGEAELLGKGEKPKTASLFKSMAPETISLDEALRLLSLPRLVGVEEGGGEEVFATNGKFGPYIKKGRTSRSLESEEQIFTITLGEALELIAQPQSRGGRRSATSVEVGVDPDGRKITLRSGRFGPYVTDGEVNATVKQFEVDMGITVERATELLADRRAAIASSGGEVAKKPAASRTKSSTTRASTTGKAKSTTATKRSTTSRKKS
ncbi:MAG: type I DNA topoisomerase [Actinomycetota bacterium]|nr:type I DNA topoisomerase [Actinomycetota bacterium]